MTKQERVLRVIARGEHSNHCHAITGDDVIVNNNEKGETIITVGDNGAVLKHLLESEWIEGKEVWTKEHIDIPIEKGTYKYVSQIEYDPYNDLIKQVKD